MTLPLRPFLLLLALLLPLPALAADLTEADVRGFLAQVDAAIARRDATALGATLSDTAEFVVVISHGGQVQPIRLDKPQYMQMLRDTWRLASDYQYQRQQQVVRITGAKATVTAQVTESMTLQGRRMTSVASETAIIERVGGRLLLTRVVANGNLQ